VGSTVGLEFGCAEGDDDGTDVGSNVGLEIGSVEGDMEDAGIDIGSLVGAVGDFNIGLELGSSGSTEGVKVGSVVGRDERSRIGLELGRVCTKNVGSDEVTQLGCPEGDTERGGDDGLELGSLDGLALGLEVG